MGWFSRSGSVGQDFSVNAAANPVSGWTLLTTIPTKPYRNFVEVQNQSTQPIQLVRDDGAGNNVTSLFLSPAAIASTQGGGWSSDTFKGRIQVYGPSGAQQVGAYQD